MWYERYVRAEWVWVVDVLFAILVVALATWVVLKLWGVWILLNSF